MVAGFDKHRGQKNLIRDLNKLYRSEPAMYEADYLQSGFEWLNHSDWENSALLMIHRNKAQDSFIITACNFTPVPRDGFRMGVPEAGRYQIVLNTDSSEYWGSDYFVGADVFHTETNCITW